MDGKPNFGVMPMKEYYTFPKAPGLEFHHQIQFSVLSSILVGEGVLLLCRDAVDVFYNPN